MFDVSWKVSSCHLWFLRTFARREGRWPCRCTRTSVTPLQLGSIIWLQRKILTRHDSFKTLMQIQKLVRTKEVVYHDITTRDNSAAPECDIYFSGAPCPAYSTAGKHGGLSDPRGSVLIHSVDYVLTQRPRVACFENVKGLVNKNNRPVLDALVQVLRKAGYKVHARVLDTCTHGGIPHHRPRVFIIAVLKNRLKKPFNWPTCIPCNSFRRFLVNNVNQEVNLTPGSKQNIAAAWAMAKKKYQEVEYSKRDAMLVCDAHAGKSFLSVMLNLSPCLTKARAGNNGHYLMSLKRWMNLWEIAGLQGWPKPMIDDLLQNFSKSDIGSTLGDGFSISLVMRIGGRALVAGGLIPKFEDQWEQIPVSGHLPDVVYKVAGSTHERMAVWA